MKIFLGGTIAFLIWSASGLYYYACHVLDSCDSEQESSVPAAYADLDYISKGLPLFEQGELVLRAPGELRFSPESSRIHIPDAYGSGLNRLARMMREKSSSQLIILSRFDPDWGEKTAAVFAFKRAERLRDNLCLAGVDCDDIQILVQAVDLEQTGVITQPLFELQISDSTAHQSSKSEIPDPL